MTMPKGKAQEGRDLHKAKYPPLHLRLNLSLNCHGNRPIITRCGNADQGIARQVNKKLRGITQTYHQYAIKRARRHSRIYF